MLYLWHIHSNLCFEFCCVKNKPISFLHNFKTIKLMGSKNSYHYFLWFRSKFLSQFIYFRSNKSHLPLLKVTVMTQIPLSLTRRLTSRSKRSTVEAKRGEKCLCSSIGAKHKKHWITKWFLKKMNFKIIFKSSDGPALH